MFNISKYLENFKKNISFNDDLNIFIIKNIKDFTGIVLNINNIEVKNNILYIKSSPAVKNKIFIYKEDIIKNINSIYNKIILDIK